MYWGGGNRCNTEFDYRLTPSPLCPQSRVVRHGYETIKLEDLAGKKEVYCVDSKKIFFFVNTTDFNLHFSRVRTNVPLLIGIVSTVVKLKITSLVVLLVPP